MFSAEFSESNPNNIASTLTMVWRALRKRWLPALVVTVIIFALVALYTASSESVYYSEMSILVDNKTSLKVTPENTQQPETAMNLATEVEILKSGPLITQALSTLSAPYNQIPPGIITSGLSIYKLGQADILVVGFRDNNPQRIQIILQALGQTYVRYSLENKRSQASNAIKFVEHRLPNAQRQLKESAIALKQFRERNKLIDPNNYANSVSDGLQALRQQEQDIRIGLDQTRRRYEALQRQVGQDPDTALATMILSQDENYQALVSQYNKAQTDYALERTRLKEAFPPIQALKARRDRLLSLIEARARRVLGSKASSLPAPSASRDLSSGPSATVFKDIQQQLAGQLLSTQTTLFTQQVQFEGVRKAQADLTRVFERIPGLQLTYAELQRQEQVDSESVNFLLRKLEELKVLEAQESSPWRVLNPPYFPGSPISPNTSRNWFVGSLAAVLFGLGTAVLLERLDDRVKSIEEAREITRLPLLGAVPEEKDLSLLYLRSSLENSSEAYAESTETAIASRFRRTAFMEALRSLAFNLRYLGSDKSIKTILFTSPAPHEGKSTIIFNLARVLAERNFRILVIDCDLRKPSLHRWADLPNIDGLSTVIATGSPWQEVVATLELTKFDIITSGPVPPDPIALLDSPRMSEILRDCREVYDYVLLDAPPTLGISDALSLVTRVDATVLVLGVGQSRRAPVARAIELLQAAHANTAGLVANFLDESSGRYFYPHYLSYYGESLPKESPERESVPNRSANRSLLDNIFRRG